MSTLIGSCRRLLYFVIPPLVMLLTADCGGSSSNQLAQATHMPAPALVSGPEEQLIPGVNHELTKMLQAELQRVLAELGTAKAPSAPPTGAENSVNDLAGTPDGSGGMDLTWSYLNVGDYDQNAEVNAADLTPIGRNYGATSDSPDWASAGLADGDGNGEINVADVTPIGRNFNRQVARYAVYSSLSQADYPNTHNAPDGPGTTEIGEITMAESNEGSGGAKKFNFNVASHADGTVYWVRPVDASGESGTPSNMYATLAPDGPGDWYMYQHDPQHTGRSSYTGPATTDLRWQIPYIGNWPSYSSVIGANGTLYVSSGELRTLLAIDQSGDELWTYDSGDAIQCCPAIGADGSLYFGTRDGFLHAVKPDGTQDWTYEFEDAVIWSSPALDLAGVIYIGSKDGRLYAINPDGSFKWSYDTGDWVYSSPAIASDGTVYIGSRNTQLHAVDSEGGFKWTFDTWGNVMGSPAIGGDGTVYVGSADQRLYAINPDGSERWSYDTGGSIECAPALAADGTIYVGAGGGSQLGVGRFLALNPDGSLMWSFEPTSACSFSSPIIDAAGSIYFGTEDGKVYALNPDGSIRWVLAAGVAVRCSASIGPDGTLFFTSNSGALFAVGPGGGEPDLTPPEILNVDPRWGDPGDEITVAAEVRGSAPITYSWNFSGACTPDTSTEVAPVIVLGDPGAYTASLEVNNPVGTSLQYHFMIIIGDDTQWSQSYYGDANDVSQDGSGNIYVAGETDWFGSSAGDALLLKYSGEGELLWASSWGGARATEVEVADDGKVSVAGAAGFFEDAEVLLLKYTPAGDLIWQRTWRGASSGFATGLALDSGMLDGIEHIYVTSTTEDTPGDYDAVLLKYAPDGSLVWQQSWGGSGIERGGPVSVHYDSIGAYEVVYTAGSTDSFSSGDADVYLLAFQPTGGDPLWARTWGGLSNDEAQALVVDSDENIYIAAQYLRDHGEGPRSDVALLKYNSGGALQFQVAWREYSTNMPRAIAIGPSGNIFIAGQLSMVGEDGQDLFLLRCSNSGDLLWQRAWGRWDGELGSPFNLGHARALEITDSGALLIAGVGGQIGLWTDAAGTAQDVIETTDSPTGTVTALAGTVTAPAGFTSIPNGAGPGDLTVMLYEPD